MIFTVSDTHFGHKKLVDDKERPKNFEKLIIDNWNRTVTENDTVLHLGDFSLGKYKNYSHRDSLEYWLDQLSGIIFLVRGNHDSNSNNWYYDRGFRFVCDRIDMNFHGRTLTFTHEPIKDPPDLNVHGHLHGNSHRLEGNLGMWYGGERYVDVSVDCTGFTPVSLESLLDHN